VRNIIKDKYKASSLCHWHATKKLFTHSWPNSVCARVLYSI